MRGRCATVTFRSSARSPRCTTITAWLRGFSAATAVSSWDVLATGVPATVRPRKGPSEGKPLVDPAEYVDPALWI